MQKDRWRYTSAVKLGRRDILGLLLYELGAVDLDREVKLCRLGCLD
jgi:hypothetical protein